MTNDEPFGKESVGLWTSSFFRHSSFELRHSYDRMINQLARGERGPVFLQAVRRVFLLGL
jgi:hypothetical protein